MENAAASETTPRMPDHPTTNNHDGLGGGSRRRTPGSSRDAYVNRYTHAKRTRIVAIRTIAASNAMWSQDCPARPRMRSGNCRPISKKTNASRSASIDLRTASS
ncbi:Uncharacterised protein [Mycobacteroides abscessus subsp. abscessus]|nr:Uncharacterised protein [Mycobacteroides abscessus subsp. abscessus]